MRNLTAQRTAGNPRTRSTRRDNGSVLILVVALLVILALLGTAYLATARVGRQAAVRDTVNTRIDLVVQAADNTIVNAITGALDDHSTGTSVQRGVSGVNKGRDSFLPWTSDLQDIYLASRVPEVRTMEFAPAIGTNPPGFRTISFPLSQTVGGQIVMTSSPKTGATLTFPGGFGLYANGGTYSSGDVVHDGNAGDYRYFRCIQDNSPINPQPPLLFVAAYKVYTVNAAYWQEISPSTAFKQYVRFEPNGSGFDLINSRSFANFGRIELAGDADGDGINDSVFWPLNIDDGSGLTWYVAYRVIDQSAALNVNTAWSRQSDLTAVAGQGYRTTQTNATPAVAAVNSTLLNAGLFTGNVGLVELFDPLNPGLEIGSVNSWRFNQITPPTWPYGAPPTAGYPYTPTAQDLLAPLFSDGAVHPQYHLGYITESELLQELLGDRIDNPGIYGSGIPYTMQSFPLSDATALASQFCVRNVNVTGDLPEVTIGTVTTRDRYPLIERALQSSLNGYSATYTATTKTSAYNPTDVSTWFALFDFGTPVTDMVNATYTGAVWNSYFRPLRAEVTTRNAVSSLAPVPAAAASSPNALASTPINPDMVPRVLAPWNSAGNYIVGDWVYYPIPPLAAGQQVYAYKCLTAGSNHAPVVIPNVYWQVEPWTPDLRRADIQRPGNLYELTGKTPVNTADFRQLWRTFYDVMADTRDSAPLTQAGLTKINDVTYNLGRPAHRGKYMFKSPIRITATVAVPDPRVVPTDTLFPNEMTDTEVLQPRAGIAAVNTESLRAPNDHNALVPKPTPIPSRTFTLYDATGTATRKVTVNGTKQQPYITEVVADVVAGAGNYVAVELYNPYEQQYPIQKGTAAPTTTDPSPVPWRFVLGNVAGTPVVAPETANDILLGCQLAIVDRSSGTPVITPIPFIFNGTHLIPSGGYIVLEDGARPAGINDPATNFNPNGKQVVVVQVPGMKACIGKELVLFRTRWPDGMPHSNKPAVTPPTLADPNVEYDPLYQYDEGTGTLADVSKLVPFDQFDTTHLTSVAAPADGTYVYARPSGPGNSTATSVYTARNTSPNLYWKCVFPCAAATWTLPVTQPPLPALPILDPPLPRANGFSAPVIPPAANAIYPPKYSPIQNGFLFGMLPVDPVLASLGKADPTFTDSTLPNQRVNTALEWPTIQINAMNWAGPGRRVIGAAPENIYPYNGFARLGDMLQITYIGSYTITDLATGTIPQEFISVSMDSLYAQASNPKITGLATDTFALPEPTLAASISQVTPPTAPPDPGIFGDEQVGRFCPLADSNPFRTPAYHDPDPDPLPYDTHYSDDLYWWTGRVFDYFCLRAPHDDYLPNVLSYQPTGHGEQNLSERPGVTPYTPPLATPDPVLNQGPVANVDEAWVATHGRININTASWRVLSMLPMVHVPLGEFAGDQEGPLITSPRLSPTMPYPRAARERQINESIARAIVEYREAHGPFRSIMDLNKVFDQASLAPSTFPRQVTTCLTPATVKTVSVERETIGFQTGGAFVFDPAAVTKVYVPYLDFTFDPEQGPTATPPRPVTPTFALGQQLSDDWGALQGDYSPLDQKRYFPETSDAPPLDGIRDDFEKRFLAVTRISNLITTRSDEFVCYVLVQGWRNNGGPNASLEVERRDAFILDRSAVTPGNPSPVITKVPVK